MDKDIFPRRVFMGSVEIKILGQHFLINPPEGKAEDYKKVADNINKMMNEEVNKSELRSDLKAAIKTAFIIALENMTLRENLNTGLTQIDKLNDILSTHRNI